MDKRIALKKPRHKRIIKNEIPDLNSGENLLYLQHYFIENSILDPFISNRITVGK